MLNGVRFQRDGSVGLSNVGINDGDDDEDGGVIGFFEIVQLEFL